MKAPILTALLIVATAAFAPASHAQELRCQDPEIGRQIAEQGNRALAQIHAQTREAVKHLSPVRENWGQTTILGSSPDARVLACKNCGLTPIFAKDRNS
jgi:hypothetical protein